MRLNGTRCVLLVLSQIHFDTESFTSLHPPGVSQRGTERRAQDWSVVLFFNFELFVQRSGQWPVCGVVKSLPLRVPHSALSVAAAALDLIT